MTIPRRFQPAPGITVDIADQSIRISGRIESWGPQSSATRAAEMQAAINRIWTASFAGGFSVSCNVTVTHRTAAATDVLQIEVDNIAGPSSVDIPLVYGPRTMQLNAGSRDVYSWVVAHEFGHVLGMADRYSETVISKLCNSYGCARTTTVERGYEALLMGAHNGALDGTTLSDLNSETAPNPYWINDDDQTRAWVMAATPATLTALPGRQKLAAIQVLMGGWISDADMTAIVRICAAVRSSADARLIRDGVRDQNFTSLEQRAQMRLAKMQMPN